MKRPKGFTIVEVAVVIVILGVLATLTTLGFNRTMSNSRNDSANSKAKLITAALEKYYDQNGEYPDCATKIVVSGVTGTGGALQGVDPGSLTRDGSGAASGTNSIVCGTTANTTNFSYSNTSKSYTLQYKEEATGNTVTLSRQRT